MSCTGTCIGTASQAHSVLVFVIDRAEAYDVVWFVGGNGRIHVGPYCFHRWPGAGEEARQWLLDYWENPGADTWLLDKADTMDRTTHLSDALGLPLRTQHSCNLCFVCNLAREGTTTVYGLTCTCCSVWLGGGRRPSGCQPPFLSGATLLRFTFQSLSDGLYLALCEGELSLTQQHTVLVPVDFVEPNTTICTLYQKA